MALNNTPVQELPGISSISLKMIPRVLWSKFVSKIPFFRKGGAAIMDQGLFAGSNFLINVLLARFMLPAEYGAFATAYAIFLLMGSFYIAILIEPMLVFGSGKYSGRWHRYLGVILYGHWVISIVLSCILIAVAYIFQQQQSGILAEAMLGLCIAQPFILMNWTLRRAFYVNSQPQWAASGGAVYLVAMLAGTIGANMLGILSSFTVLIVIALASLVTSIWFMFLLKPVQLQKPDDDLSVMQVFKDHFGYGKWSAPTMLLTWIPSNIYYTVLPLMVGLAGSAALKVSMNMIMPILHANTAISVLLAPSFVRALKYGGKDQLKKRTYFGLAVFTATCTVYWIILMVYGRQMVDFIGNGQYTDTVNLGILFLMGLIPLTNGIGEIISGSLRAIGRLDYILWTHLVSGAFTITAGIGMLWLWGTTGAYAGLLFASAVAAIIAYVLYVRGLRTLKRERIDELHSFDSTEAAVAASKRKDFGVVFQQAKANEIITNAINHNDASLRILALDYDLNPDNHDGNWDVIKRMVDRKHAVWIVTSNHNRRAIERYMKENNLSSNWHCVFFDLPLAGSIAGISQALYRWLWELAVIPVAFLLNKKNDFDVAHQFYARKNWRLTLLPLLRIPTIISGFAGSTALSDEKSQNIVQPNSLQKLLLNRADVILVTDHRTQQSISQWCKADVKVQYASSLKSDDIERFATVHSTPEKPIRFISHGAVSDKHGLAIALEAFANCLKTKPDMEFWIYGLSSLHRELQPVITQHDLGNRVWLKGELTREEWHKSLQYCHAVVHSDLTGMYSPRLAESMIAGRPVILFETGMNAEWATNENSFPVQAKEHANLAKGLETSMLFMAENGVEHTRIGSNACAFALKEMYISKHVSQLLRVYRQLSVVQSTATQPTLALSGGD